MAGTWKSGGHPAQVWAIARRDLVAAFTSPLAWLVLFAWLAALGFFWCLDLDAANSTDGQPASAPLYLGSLFLAQWLLIGFGPALTMNAFAAERTLGTLDWLGSLPLDPAVLVLGKALASFVLLATLVAATLVQPAFLWFTSELGGLHLVAGYLGLLLFCVLLSGLGTLLSLLVESPVAAYVLTVGALLVLVAVGLFAEAPGVWPPCQRLGEWCGLGPRLISFLEGRPRPADAGALLAGGFGCLLIAHTVVKVRRHG